MIFDLKRKGRRILKVVCVCGYVDNLFALDCFMGIYRHSHLTKTSEKPSTSYSYPLRKGAQLHYIYHKRISTAIHILPGRIFSLLKN